MTVRPVTKFFCNAVVFREPTTFDVVTGLSVLFGRNVTHSPASTNAVGKSLLASVVPECLFDAAPLQAAGGRGDFKTTVTGEAYGFEFVDPDGKTYQVQKRGAGTGFKLDIFEDGGHDTLAHKKGDAQAWLAKRFPISEALYYTTVHLSSRLRAVCNYRPSERLVLFEPFLSGYELDAVAERLANRTKVLAEVAQRAEAAREVLAALPAAKPPRPWVLFGASVAKALAEKRYDDARAQAASSPQALYAALPAGLQKTYSLGALVAGGAALLAKFAAKRDAALHAQRGQDERQHLEAQERDLERQAARECGQLWAALRELSDGPPDADALVAGASALETSPAARDFLQQVVDAQHRKAKARARLQESQPKGTDPVTSSLLAKAKEAQAVVKGFGGSLSNLSSTYNIAAALGATLQDVADAPPSGDLKDVLQTLAHAKLPAKTLSMFFVQASRKLAALSLLEQLDKAYPQGLERAHNDAVAAESAAALSQGFDEALKAYKAYSNTCSELRAVRRSLEDHPAYTGPSVETWDLVLKVTRQLQHQSRGGAAESQDLVALNMERQEAQQTYFQLLAQRDSYESQRQQRASLRAHVAAFDAVREEHEDLVLLKSVFSSKGVKAALLDFVAKQYEKGLNAAAPLLFLEPISFGCKVDGGSLYILAQRAGKRVCDVSKFSGSEAHAFALCHVLAMLPLLPASHRLNYVVLDEMESTFSAALKDRFVKDYLPALCQAVPSVLVVTTAQPQDFDFAQDDVSKFVLTHKDGFTTLKKLQGT